MNEKRKKRYEKILAGGRKRYVLIQGGLGWGLPVAIISSVWDALDKSGYTLAKIDWLDSLLRWLFSLPFLFAGGCLFGLFMYDYMIGMREDAERAKQK